ncbi:MAG: NUDIX hydrolase [Leptodesmis sp.]
MIFRTEWIAVKESSRGFQYLERKGKDSVAVFLLRKGGVKSLRYEVLIRQQHLCIDNREVDGTFTLFPYPITGGLEEGELPEAAAMRETFEETGYRVQVLPLGKYIVGTQLNEICYLYYTDVTGLEPDPVQQDGTYLSSGLGLPIIMRLCLCWHLSSLCCLVSWIFITCIWSGGFGRTLTASPA